MREEEERKVGDAGSISLILCEKFALFSKKLLTTSALQYAKIIRKSLSLDSLSPILQFLNMSMLSFVSSSAE